MAIIKNENGSLEYTIEYDEIIIDLIEVKEKRKGTGKQLIDELKSIAAELNLPIVLFVVPQDDTIDKDSLICFYKKCSFDFHPDDADYSYMIWGR